MPTQEELQKQLEQQIKENEPVPKGWGDVLKAMIPGFGVGYAQSRNASYDSQVSQKQKLQKELRDLMAEAINRKSTEARQMVSSGYEPIKEKILPKEAQGLPGTLPTTPAENEVINPISLPSEATSWRIKEKQYKPEDIATSPEFRQEILDKYGVTVSERIPGKEYDRWNRKLDAENRLKLRTFIFNSGKTDQTINQLLRKASLKMQESRDTNRPAIEMQKARMDYDDTITLLNRYFANKGYQATELEIKDIIEDPWFTVPTPFGGIKVGGSTKQIIQPKQGQAQPQKQSQELTGNKIKVKLKSTGQTGTILPNEFNPDIYERI